MQLFFILFIFRFLDLYDNKLNFLTRVTMQMKIVESVKWHPRYTFISSKGSDYSLWFAAAGNDENIQIFDTSDIKSNFLCFFILFIPNLESSNAQQITI